MKVLNQIALGLIAAGVVLVSSGCVVRPAPGPGPEARDERWCLNHPNECDHARWCADHPNMCAR